MFLNYQHRINELLNRVLPPETVSPQRLHQAMRYAVLNGGKRIRPLLVYTTGELFHVSLANLDYAAAALELIHCYSLLHDDLPAMDDDDLRRGQLTCHKAFDEATAILAGDALQTLAFKVLTQTNQGEVAPSVILKMTDLLAEASGSFGMCGGQTLDLQAEGQTIDLAQLEIMHRMKTGALITVAVQLGALLGNAKEAEQTSLQRFAANMGLAFQIQDDILDLESTTEKLGKQQGADIALNKPTYVSLMGMIAAKEHLQTVHQTALLALKEISADTKNLQQLAHYIVNRQQ